MATLALTCGHTYMTNDLGPLIDLAREESFRIGPLQVDPPLCRVSTGETLEPRVMQVLVALARAQGAVVSRDELVQACWGGRIVGEDSINRAISRLRRLAKGRGGGDFAIETVPKVGYRLIGELSSVVPTSPPPAARPGSSVTPTGARKRTLLYLVVAGCAIVAIAGLASWSYFQTRSREPARLAVETFATSGVPAATAETLRSAMVSAVAPERFRVVGGSGSPADYRLTGRLIGSQEGVTLYAELSPPRFGPPIWTPQVRFARDASMSGVGNRLVSAARCIVEGDREPPIPKGPAALAGWASYCDENSKDVYDENHQLEALRAATKAEPRFMTAQVTLAFFLGEDAMDTRGGRADALRAEGLRAAATAEKVDPDNASVYLARSILTPATDFQGRDRLIAKALAVRPTGWGEEFQSQAQFLWSVGRLNEAFAAAKRSLAINPGNSITTLQSAAILSMMARYRQARPIFEDEAATRSDRSVIDQNWLRAALSEHDWAAARRLVSSEPDDGVRTAMATLIAALESGKTDRVSAAGSAFEPLAQNPNSLGPLTVLALALSGRDVAAIDAVWRLFGAKGVSSLRLIYSPAFATARTRPEFEALTRKTGLFDYWKTSGRPPDFCLAADAPSLCAKLSGPGQPAA
jgi:DNA-binding winged helix-turn-helix (wHTH) protein/tetratricopeptide (TPR) repeat protein